MDFGDLLVPQRDVVITQHVIETADEIRAQEGVKGLPFRALRVPPEDARVVHRLARFEMGREGRLDRAPALDVAPDEGPEFTYVVGHAAHEFAVLVNVRSEGLVLLECDVGRSGAGFAGVQVVGREAIFADNHPVLIEELAACDHALIPHGGRLGLGEYSASRVFCLAHVEREDFEWIHEIFIGDCVEPQVSPLIPDLVIISQWRDVHVFSV